jgi:squalene-associated FAD-dependent desaturase
MGAHKRTIIIGGGLAGLAAAVALAEEGMTVTLLERKPFLGGRASSYPVRNQSQGLSVGDREDQSDDAWSQVHDASPLWVDNCQHVLLKCCTNLLDFYRRLDAQKGVAFSDRIVFLDEHGQQATLTGSRLMAPFHLLPSFLRFTPLRWRDKLAIAYAFCCMLLGWPRLQGLDQMTMLQWLERHRQPSRAIEQFWRTFLVSALNEDIEVASARYGIQVFLEGMLSKLYTDPCLKFLGERGCAVHLRSNVTKIETDGVTVQGVVLSDGSRLTGDYYLSAVTPNALTRLLPAEVVERTEYFANLHHLGASPITAIYLWFDREITDLEYAALLGHEMQWIFNKGVALDSGGAWGDHCLGLVISASDKFLPLGRQEILEMALRDVRKVLPAAREAVLLGSVVIKEPFATFSCRAGCDRFRPDQKSPLENFFIAGDWTRTGWPGTMEGAVRSGYRCAELVLQAEGIDRSLIQSDLPAQGLVRWLFWFFRLMSGRHDSGPRSSMGMGK